MRKCAFYCAGTLSNAEYVARLWFKEYFAYLLLNLLYICFIKPYLNVVEAQLIKHCNKERFCALKCQSWAVKIGQQKEEVGKNRAAR